MKPFIFFDPFPKKKNFGNHNDPIQLETHFHCSSFDTNHCNTFFQLKEIPILMGFNWREISIIQKYRSLHSRAEYLFQEYLLDGLAIGIVRRPYVVLLVTFLWVILTR